MEQEVLRVKEVFESCEPSCWYESEEFEYAELQKGNYKCFVYYYVKNPEDELFEKASGNYIYYMFAYDKVNGTVRYIYSASPSCLLDQPYYLTLDW